ncbi:aspartate-semialdehyde dehydrogenase [Actinoplanes derwentensis]|uniref:Aspartate-semialdehyde dehydrogenase n=1 Tax=Actinoplanes derwentensis TaxID=113562 RepID=A0A1H2CXL1_9ACTN|nr:aspartate-semialdehyde dehydrogenase [Actinoplanes derwentensis]GID82854.1 aspartate-semialdehyde dehydrogenase [Actinoplanes derwentensis]SDT75235.1 aspartate semialdehyde dehydrogenase [Actinoplanes derwentensis]
MAQPTLAVVGATGSVGSVMLELLSARRNHWGEIRLLASARSVGKSLTCRGERLDVAELTAEAFDGVDVAMFNVPDAVAEHWAPIAVSRGVTVVDNSAAFRMRPEVPLVVPEVNREAVRSRPIGIVSSANSATASMIVAVAPLHDEFGLRELVLASYQSASGAGQLGVDTLHDQLTKVAGDRLLGSRTGNVRQAVGDDLGPFPAPLALNVVPWAGDLADLGWSSEEIELRNESRKILGLPALKVSATCVRVPVVTGHSIAVHAVFASEVTADGARQVLRNAPGVILVDDPESGEFPMPIDAVGTDPSWVGRIRRAMDDPRALSLFITGDNMRKGAALNTVQIAELIAAEIAKRA